MLKFFIFIFMLTSLLSLFTGSEGKMPARVPEVVPARQIDTRPLTVGSESSVTIARTAALREERPIRIASYNVHKCTGMDARRDPDRIAQVIRSLDADIISLQEVLSDTGDGPSAQVRYLAEKTGMYAAVAAPTKRKKDGLYGNALLSRFPIAEARLHDISFGSYEPRGIIDADIMIGGAKIRVISTHLGLWPSERNRQTDRLLEILPEKPDTPLIVMGDMNGWVPGSTILRRLRKRLGNPVSMASFPAPLALLPLDKIWVLHSGKAPTGGVVRSELARIASDHLPLVATVYLDALASRITATASSL